MKVSFIARPPDDDERELHVGPGMQAAVVLGHGGMYLATVSRSSAAAR